MAAKDTKVRILDAAERLFSEHGFAGTSLRSVTSAAGVNLAAVHYHFGSKEALLQSTLHRRVAPINQERLKRLERLEARAEGGSPGVEEIVAAFLEPALQIGDDAESGGVWVRKLAARVFAEPRELVEPILRQEFHEVSERFVAALARALPHLPRVELEWRYQFTVGVLIFVVAERYVTHLTHFDLQPADNDAMLRRMRTFLIDGLRAPAAPDPGRA